MMSWIRSWFEKLYVKYAKIVLFSKSLYVFHMQFWRISLDFFGLLLSPTKMGLNIVVLIQAFMLFFDVYPLWKYNDHQIQTCFVFFLRCVLHFDRYSSWNHDLNEIEQERMRKLSTEGGGQGHPPIKLTSNTTEGVQEYMDAVLRHPWSSSCAVL